MPITKDRLSSKPEPVSGKEPLEIREFSSLYDVAKNYTETIKKTIEKTRQNNEDTNAALEEVDKLYIEDNFVKEEADLCAILSNVKLFLDVDERMQKIRDEKNKTKDPKRERELDQQLRLEKNTIIPFNHQVRDFLLENGDFISPVQMSSLLAKMNNGITAPFDRLIIGLQAEVAVLNLIKEIPDITARPATELEDARGVDIVISSPQLLELDIKTGGGQGDGLGRQNELDIDRNNLNNRSFELTPLGKHEVTKELRERLQK